MDAKQRLEAWDVIFSALAHATRRHILLVLWFRGGTMSAGDIVARFQCAWPTISRHLRKLEDAGLIECEKKGRARHYRLHAEKLQLVREWLDWFDPGARLSQGPKND